MLQVAVEIDVTHDRRLVANISESNNNAVKQRRQLRHEPKAALEIVFCQADFLEFLLNAT